MQKHGIGERYLMLFLGLFTIYFEESLICCNVVISITQSNFNGTFNSKFTKYSNILHEIIVITSNYHMVLHYMAKYKVSKTKAKINKERKTKRRYFKI